jgi:hypothetical protein
MRRSGPRSLDLYADGITDTDRISYFFKIMINTYHHYPHAMARAIEQSVVEIKSTGGLATISRVLAHDSDALLVLARDAFNVLPARIKLCLSKSLALVQSRMDLDISIQQVLALAIYHCFLTNGPYYGLTYDDLPEYLCNQLAPKDDQSRLDNFLSLHEAAFNAPEPVARLPLATYGEALAQLKGIPDILGSWNAIHTHYKQLIDVAKERSGKADAVMRINIKDLKYNISEKINSLNAVLAEKIVSILSVAGIAPAAYEHFALVALSDITAISYWIDTTDLAYLTLDQLYNLIQNSKQAALAALASCLAQWYEKPASEVLADLMAT